MYNFEEICWICLLENSNLKYLNDKFDVNDNNLKILDVFNDFTVIKVMKKEGLALKICQNCIEDLKKIYYFVKKCEKATEILTNLSENPTKVFNDEKEKIKTETSEIEDLIYEEDSYEAQDQLTPDQKVRLEQNPEDSSEAQDQITSKEKVRLEKNLEDLNENVQKTTKSRKKFKKKNKQFECKKCNLSFVSRKNLIAHWNSAEHKNRPYPKKNCPICQKVVHHKTLCKHIKIHNRTESYVCPYCSKIYTMNSNLKRHIQEAHENVRSHICEKCGQGYCRKSVLLTHKCFYENESNTVVLRDRIKKCYAKIKCYKCDRSFRGSGALKLHQQRVHKTSEIKEIVAEKLETEQSCKSAMVVEKSCVTITNGKEIQNSDELDSKSVKFLCAICGRGFSTKILLQSHSIVHSNEKPYTCEVCQKSFSRINTLEVHMRSHTGEKPYACIECGKKFAQQTHLRYHKRIHTGEKPYECHTCLKRFSLKGTLTVHLRTHTGERPYKCRFCDSAFYDSSSAKKHERQNHSHLFQISLSQNNHQLHENL